MRIVASEFVSLDGVVQAPGGQQEDTSGGFRHGGWSIPFFDPGAMGALIGEIADQSEALLQGRLTNEVSSTAWPDRSGDPFSDWINAAQKYVVSDSLAEEGLTWGPAAIIRGGELARRGGGVAFASLEKMSTSTGASRWSAPCLLSGFLTSSC
jgi:hypothetical protein